MLRLWLLLVAAIPAWCGVVQGIVVEHASGKALSRTAVFLAPVPATAAADPAARPITAQTGLSGQFSFSQVPPGLYMLVATRDGYFPGAFGQRLATGRGEPFAVTEETRVFAEVRMRHKAAITGRVLDENGVGASRVNVVAYKARLPLRSAGQAVSDDRGVFRIAGLEPGKYWVRSGPHTLPEGGMWLPSFAPQGHETRGARVFQAVPDADTGFADISPLSGWLYTLSGPVTCDHGGEVVVTLSSDTGQQVARTVCSPSGPGGFQFSGLAAGYYELSATFVDNSGAAFAELTLGGNTKTELSLTAPPAVTVEWYAGPSQRVQTPGVLLARRQSLAESGPVFEVKQPRIALAPGYWEFRAQAPPGYYVSSIGGTRVVQESRRKSGQSSDWFEVYVRPGWTISGTVRVVLGTDPASIEGKVTAEGKAAAGVPVYLWPVSEAARRSLSGVPQTISAADGSYRFDRLPPGSYRLVASFDVSEIDEDLAEQISSISNVFARGGQSLSLNLPLWKSP